MIAVFKRSVDDKTAGTGVCETLAAFTAQSAVIAANAGLVTRLRTSLERELKANRRKDEFVATISHELRTPLTVMLGAAQTLLRIESRIEPEGRDRLLRTAVEQGQRLKLLIEDLLLVAAAEQGKLNSDLETLTTAQIADEIRSDLTDQLHERIRIRNLAVDAVALSDRYKLRQVVTNLADNAAKYGGDGPIEIDITDSADHVCISVADHGQGIPEADRTRIFDRFVQLDQSSTRAQGGTGLGLFICKTLAEQIGAELAVDETPGGGSTFTLRLPRRHQRRQDDPEITLSPPASATPVGLLRRPDMTRPPVAATQ